MIIINNTKVITISITHKEGAVDLANTLTLYRGAEREVMLVAVTVARSRLGSLLSPVVVSCTCVVFDCCYS